MSHSCQHNKRFLHIHQLRHPSISTLKTNIICTSESGSHIQHDFQLRPFNSTSLRLYGSPANRNAAFCHTFIYSIPGKCLIVFICYGSAPPNPNSCKELIHSTMTTLNTRLMRGIDSVVYSHNSSASLQLHIFDGGSLPSYHVSFVAIQIGTLCQYAPGKYVVWYAAKW